MSLCSCSKFSNGVPPAPVANKFLQGADGPPLWLVDNTEVSNPNGKGGLKINPNDIQSITVLSPASTIDLVSRYGSRAKNGIVFVTTKRVAK
jgi:hypothetical protein